jgi:hypothetical protein
MLVATLYLVTAVALLVLAARFVRDFSRAAALVLLLLPLCFTGRALLTGRVYAPIEMPYIVHPMRDHRGELGVPATHDPNLFDIAFQMIPYREALRHSIANLEWPLLNRYAASGDVLAAGMQAAPYSPFAWIACIAPTVQSFTFTGAIAFFIAGLGMFLFARELGASERASIVAAIAFMFSAPVAFQILWPVGFAWVLLPFVLTAVKLRSITLLTIALVLEIAAGHPETLVHVVVIGCAYGVFELFRHRDPGAIGSALVAGVLALLIGAIALLPFLDAREQTVEHQIRRAYAASPLHIKPDEPREALIADLFPFTRTKLLARAEAGSIVLALALFGVWCARRRGETWFFVALGIVGVLAGASAWPVAQLLHRVPILSMAMNDRLAAAVPLCLGVLAAFAVDQLTRRAAFAMFAVFAIVAWGVHAFNGDPPRIVAELIPLALAAIVVLIASPLPPAPLHAAAGRGEAFTRETPLPAVRGEGGPFDSAQGKLRPGEGLVLALIALILAQRIIADGYLIPVNDPHIAYPRTPIFAPMLAALRSGEPFRIVGTNGALMPNTPTMYGLEDIRGTTPMTLAVLDETAPLFARTRGGALANLYDLTRPMLSMMNARFGILYAGEGSPSFGWHEVVVDAHTRLVENERVLPRAFAPRHIVFADDLEAMKREIDFGDRSWINAGGPPGDQENGRGTITTRPRKLGYDLDANMERQGFVVISQAAWRGWRAYVDGQPVRVLRANHAFLAIYLPAGHHRVRLMFLPRSFAIGRTVTAATLLLLIGCRLSVWRWRRRSASTPARPK